MNTHRIPQLAYSECKAMGNTLLYLPQELRDEIYAQSFEQYDCASDPGNTLQNGPFKAGPPEGDTKAVEIDRVVAEKLENDVSLVLPSLCQVLPESIPEWIKPQSFSLPQWNAVAYFVQLLRAIPYPEAFAYVRAVRVGEIHFHTIDHGFHEHEATASNETESNVHELLSRCVGLRSLDMDIQVYPKVIYDTAHTDNEPADMVPTVKEDFTAVLEKHILPHLYDMKNLKQLTLHLKGWRGFSGSWKYMTINLTRIEPECGKDVGQFVANKLKKNGQSVQVFTTYTSIHQFMYHI